MSKPIDTLDFWKQRIDTAVKPHYAVYVANEVLWKNILNAHVKTIQELIKPDDNVLDAGCAFGRLSEYFEKYTGVDFSPDFIKQAKEKYPKKDFMVGNLKELPFLPEVFDWAICVSIKKMVVDNLGEEEWKQMEKELKRVAKKVLILEYEDYASIEIL